MANFDCKHELSRRRLLQLSAASTGALVFPHLAAALAPSPPTEQALYASTLQSWCDGLLAHQLSDPDPALHGALLCPACGLIHGRCGDAVYPLLRVAHSTGNPKYLQSALAVHNWSERNVSRADGSWINDLVLSNWQGITVFRTIAIAEALQHHGSLLDARTRQQWTGRVERAAKFLDGFITIDTGNINYPITSTLAFTLSGQLLGEQHYLDRARTLAHATLDRFTPNGLLFGEGHPTDAITPKHCRPVDLGYNVEESLPALALYALLNEDQQVLDQVIVSLRAHMEFMLPDGAWDNSWGSRNYKWSYWGSRTSDGCQPAYALLADRDPRFREVALRNLELMAACTHSHMLYGGPAYVQHGDKPCIHHAFTHAKALATVLDRGHFPTVSATRPSLARDEPYAVRSFPEIGTHLASVGPWRATVTENDFEYVEHVQTNGGPSNSGGGHASGGALTFLYHQQLGPILTASMTQYSLVEIANQQQFTDAPHMTLTPRVECIASGKTYTSLPDLEAKLTVNSLRDEVVFTAQGSLLTTSHQPLPGEGIAYTLTYSIRTDSVEIAATATGTIASPMRLIVPVISPTAESVSLSNPHSALILKPAGNLTVDTDAPQGFEPLPNERTFNLVPGFECIPFSVLLSPGKETRLKLGLFYAS
jgi:hypothetical protein